MFAPHNYCFFLARSPKANIHLIVPRKTEGCVELQGLKLFKMIQFITDMCAYVHIFPQNGSTI